MWLARPRPFFWVLAAIAMVVCFLATPVQATPLPTEPRDNEFEVFKGLAVRVRPAKAVFGKQETPGFDVILKNVSDEELSVNMHGGWSTVCGLGYRFNVYVKGIPTGGPWMVHPLLPCEREALEEKHSRKLAPGGSITFQIMLEGVAFVPQEPKEGTKGMLQLSPGEYQATIHFVFDKNQVIKDDRRQYVGQVKSRPASFQVGAKPSDGK